MQVEILEQSKIAIKDIHLLLQAAKEAKKQEDKNKSVDVSAYSRVKSKFKELLELRPSAIKFSYKDLSQAIKSLDIKAMSATSTGIPSGANILCTEKRAPVYIQDVLPVLSIDKTSRIFTVNSISARSNLFSYTPIAENAAKPETNTSIASTGINRVKLAWHERNSIEAERYHNAGEYITNSFLIKLAESIHFYILQQLAAGVAALPAALLPGAGSIPNAVFVDGIYALAQMVSFYANTDCESEFHLWLPPADYLAYSMPKATTLEPIRGIDGYREHLVEDRIAGIKVYPHAVFGGQPAGHALLGTNNILLYDTMSVIVGVDDEVLVFRQELPEENRVRYVVEMFVVAGRIPQPNAFLATGVTAPFVFVTNRSFINSNI